MKRPGLFVQRIPLGLIHANLEGFLGVGHTGVAVSSLCIFLCCCWRKKNKNKINYINTGMLFWRCGERSKQRGNEVVRGRMGRKTLQKKKKNKPLNSTCHVSAEERAVCVYKGTALFPVRIRAQKSDSILIQRKR